MRCIVLNRLIRLSSLKLVLLLFVACSAPIASFAQDSAQRWAPTLPSNVEKIADLEFIRYGDRQLRLDLYRPKEQTRNLLPAVVVIRGGAWRRGDKEPMGAMAAALASYGMVAVTIEYRPSTEEVFPAALLDAKAAVRWLRRNAMEHSIDPESIGAIGQSAGGHLALLLGLTPGQYVVKHGDSGKKESSAVQAVVGFGAPVQFHTHPDLEPARVFFGAEYADKPEIWHAAAPVSHVSPDAPPTLLVTGLKDAVVPSDHPFVLAAAYQQHGVEIEIALLREAPHSFWNKEEWFDYSIERAARFLLRHL